MNRRNFLSLLPACVAGMFAATQVAPRYRIFRVAPEKVEAIRLAIEAQYRGPGTTGNLPFLISVPARHHYVRGHLVPVGLDFDGSYKPLDQLSYKLS